MGYRPNAVARNLRRRRTSVWALVITDIENPFYTAVARGVEDAARSNGYSVLLCNSDEDQEREARYLQVAAGEHVAGLILAPRNASTDVSELRAAGIPVVVVDRSCGAELDTVRTKSSEGARIATEHLLAEGWRRPACITGPADAETAEARHAGSVLAVDAHGTDDLTRHVSYDSEGGRAAAADLLDSDARPDAFFVANSMLALGVLGELRRRALRVGSDVGLVMFDDAPWARLLDPAISVVSQSAYEMGGRAGELLLDRLSGSGPAEPRNEYLPATLIVRESSRR
nr:substrate-binding domain-containing protein [Spelaeicoccus albus]